MISETYDRATVTIQLVPQDVARFRAFVGDGMARTLRGLAMLFLAIVLMAAAYSLRGAGSSYDASGVLVLPTFSFATITNFLTQNSWIFVVALFFSSFAFFYWRATRRAVLESNSPAIFQAMTLEPTEDGFHFRSDASETLHRWHSIIRFAETREDFYAMLAPKNGYVIPKRCFATPEAMAIFQNRMNLLLEKFAPAALTGSNPA